MFHLSFTAADLRRVIWTALFAFAAAYGSFAAGIGDFHNFGEAKAAALALIPTGLAAAFSAVKNAVLADSSKLK